MAKQKSSRSSASQKPTNDSKTNPRQITTKSSKYGQKKSSSTLPFSFTSFLTSKCFQTGVSPLHSAVLLVVLTLASLMVFQNAPVLHSWGRLLWAGNWQHKDDNSTTGGWRPPTAEVLRKYGSEICTIERISVTDLTPERFEAEVRFKKPVIVTFPNGASDWTEPEKWSRDELVKAYSKWTIHSGQSLEIVRKGGNAEHATSFLDFIDTLLGDEQNGTGEPMHYAFDRHFYWQSQLPKTLKLPQYLKVNTSLDESIFFLGSSATGVVFHKHSDTWNGVVFGRKRWFLYPNTRTPPGGVHHGFRLLDWVTQVYPNLTDLEKPMECVQGPGEILYLPEGTYHATLNLGDTIAVAIQKKEATLKPEILSYEATKLINFLQEKKKPDPKNSFHVRLLEIYKEWSELLPESAEAVMKIGLTLYDMEQYTESLPWHMKAIEMDPYFIMAYIHLGKTFMELRQYERAETTFLKAIEISPNFWDNYKEYGEFLLKQGRQADALPIFKKGTELMPKSVPFWFYYKLCQVGTGDLEGAEASEKMIAEIKAQQQQR